MKHLGTAKDLFQGRKTELLSVQFSINLKDIAAGYTAVKAQKFQTMA